MMITIHNPVAYLLGVAITVAAASTSAQTASVDASFSVNARALAAIQVPEAAIELRAVGVPEPEVHTALVAVHHHHIPAPEVHLMLTHSVRHVRVHGPLPSFGHFVELQLDEGFRGPRLYKSLRIEHQHPGRGHGPPAHAKAHGHRKLKVRGRKHGNARVDVHVTGPHLPHPPHPTARLKVDVRGGHAPHPVKFKGGHKLKIKRGHKLKVKGGGKFKGGHGRGKH